jgi:hypothetical protein
MSLGETSRSEVFYLGWPSIWKGGLHQGLLLEDPGFYLDVSSTWKMGFISIMVNTWMDLGG